MSSYRKYAGLAALLLVVLAGRPAVGQDHELRGMQLFEPTDVRPYGNWAQPRTGFFLTFDGIYWHISPPDKTTIGFPGLTHQVLTDVPASPDQPDVQAVQTTEQNSLTTNFRAKWKQGDRFELGYVGEHHGWLITTLDTARQTQWNAAQHAAIVFADPTFNGHSLLETVYGSENGITTVTGDPLRSPVIFDQVSVANRTKFSGVEAAYLYRQHQLHHGGTIEWLLGARYFQLDDNFTVNAFGGNLADSFWENEVKNRIVGPEIGLRYYKPFGRFALSSEGRFTAGVNTQSVHLNGILGSTLTEAPTDDLAPRLMRATGFNHTANFYEFTPLAEFRIEAHMQLTRLISAKVGWNAMYMDGIARASNMINYAVGSPNGPMPITTEIGEGNRQDVFVHGLTLGIEINR